MAEERPDGVWGDPSWEVSGATTPCNNAHARDNPDADYEFEELGKEKPGVDLDRLEEDWIRAGGGPTNKSNPNGGLENKRHQMNDKAYKEAGGEVEK